MRKKIVLIMLCISLLPVLTYGEEETKDSKNIEVQSLKEFSRIFVSISKKVSPAVVNITTTQIISRRTPGYYYFGPGLSPFDDDSLRDFFGDDFFRFTPKKQPYPEQKRIQKSMGSGVIIDEQGYILTNNHVVANANEITVKLFNGEEYKAKVIGADPKTDIAVIKIEAKNLTKANIGNSDNIQVGDWVLAVGNPFGLDQTVTAGIISAKGRSRIGIADYEDFIQTDAAINPGNSGGPLVNLEGEVVGINTAIFSQSGGYQGVGFAVPINMAKAIMESLIKKGKVIRGFLGVNIQDITSDLAKSFNLSNKEGSLISNVLKDSPAYKAGLKNGDIIITYDNKKIIDTAQLRNIVAETEVGKEVEIEVIRDQKKQIFKVKIGQYKEEEESAMEDFGLSIQELTHDLAKKFGYEEEAGVLVVNVQPDSSGEQAGIKRGDLIIEVNNIKVKSLLDFKKALSSSEDLSQALFLVQSGDVMRYIVVKKNP
ncbi:MAG: DegQ family serine endoprotease [Candidatus Firestonebacteria bacterium]|nr:DegQ family serine endoprotease [Candidatus Firestonebacteria bacterium]